jgi:hypothetical protein
MMSYLCNHCVREFLILARTWFAFGLLSKSGVTPTISVSNLAPTSKFIVRVLGSGGCARLTQDLYWFGQNIPTSCHWRLVLPAPLMIRTRSRGYKRTR